MNVLAERYRVVERLGLGGMATVYLAHDERLDRPVAVKRMHAPSDGDDGSDARRFEREAKIGASLSHPNLVSIFDTEQDGDSVLLVMEYVDGETLADLLARGPVDPERAVEIVKGVARALDHAHANGVVHRDIKPANVLLGKDGSVKLADLGIAKAIERTDITNTGMVLGTPAYMAPEQLEGGKVGPAVDIYALSAMAFEMLTGERPHTGRTAVEIAHQVVNEPAPDPRDVDPAFPGAAAKAIRDGLARDPADRPEHATDLAAQLEKAQLERARPVAVLPDTLAQTLTRPVTSRGARTPTHRVRTRRSRRGRAIAVGALFAVAIAAFVIGLASEGGDESKQQASPAAGNPDPTGKPDPTKKPAADQTASEQKQPAAESQPAAPAAPEPAEADPIARAHELQLQGYSALQAGDYTTAIELSRQAVEAFPPGTTDPQYGYALFNLGQALRLAGRPEEAIPVLEQRLQIPDQTKTVEHELKKAEKDAKKAEHR